MDFKFCPECGAKLEKTYKFCPECGLNLLHAEQAAREKEIEEMQRLRKEAAEEEFRKSVLEVAEAFFAMSEEERKAMIEYAEDRCREAEEEANALNKKQ